MVICICSFRVCIQFYCSSDMQSVRAEWCMHSGRFCRRRTGQYARRARRDAITLPNRIRSYRRQRRQRTLSTFCRSAMGAPMLELAVFNMMCSSARRQLLIAVYRWRSCCRLPVVVEHSCSAERTRIAARMFQCIRIVHASTPRFPHAFGFDSVRPTARQNAIVNSCFIELLCIISVVVLGISCVMLGMCLSEGAHSLLPNMLCYAAHYSLRAHA